MTVRREGPGVLDVSKVLRGLDDHEGRVGWFESARYEDGTPVAYVATIQEFGSGAIPARPFMRPAVAEHGQEWLDQLAAGAKKAVQPGATLTPLMVLEAVAMMAAGNVGEKISEVTEPPLSQITLIARKTGKFTGGADVGAAAALVKEGITVSDVSTKPLVDTGQMIQSVTGVVERTR